MNVPCFDVTSFGGTAIVPRTGSSQAHNFTTRFTATPSSFSWTRRKRSAVEVAAGDGAVSTEVAQRLKAIALASDAESPIDSSPSSAEPTENSAETSISSESDNAAGSRGGRQIRELPIGAFQKLPQVRSGCCLKFVRQTSLLHATHAKHANS